MAVKLQKNVYLIYHQHNGKARLSLPTKSDSDVRFCLYLLSKTLICTLQLS